MKKTYALLFLFTFSITFAFAQVAGTWKMAPQAAALGVGPELGDISWWSNSAADVTVRACYFDDEYVFSEDGTFQNVLQDESWIEPWQGMDPEACGAPVAPHDGSNAATWTYDAAEGTITINGEGAYLGLSKVVNDGELSTDPPAPLPSSITYPVEFNATNDTMTINIFIGNGYWRYILTTNAGDPPAPSVSFNVDMSYQVALGVLDPAADFVDIAGDFNNWGDPVMELTAGENDIYSITLEDFTAGQEIAYKFRINGNWDTSEFPEGGPDRTYTVTEGLNIITVWYNDETPPPSQDITLPCTFNDVELNYNLTDFGGNWSSIIEDPTDPTNRVVETFRDAEAQTWAGTTVAEPAGFVPAIPFTADLTQMRMRVYSPAAGIPILFKLEVWDDIDTFVEVSTSTTVADEWETLYFDFSGDESFNLDNPYNKAVVFFNFGTAGGDAGEMTFMWDDIEFVDPSGIYDNKNTLTKVYPNPATDVLYLENAERFNAVSIYSVTGQLIYQSNEVSNSIRLESFPKGMYTLHAIGDDDQKYFAKFIVK